uniref:Uncharacterized protein n=1 Tax=Arundo donax TaxID=35708 RepID=A0A0A9B6U7_ARUDO
MRSRIFVCCALVCTVAWWMMLGGSFARLKHKGSHCTSSIMLAWLMCLVEQAAWRKHSVLLEACQ